MENANPGTEIKKTRVTCMHELNTCTNIMLYVTFMCMYASSNLQSDKDHMKHFMVYVCMSNTYTYIQHINCFMCMYSSSEIQSDKEQI